MRILQLSELEAESLRFEVLECHRQIWKNGRTWLGNEEEPRPTDGLVVICSPVRVTFRTEGLTLMATEGDVVYVPRNTRYTAEFRGGGFDPDTYTVNFAIHDANGEEVRLSESLSILVGSASPDCRHAASELRLLCLDPRGNPLRRRARFLDLLAAMTDSESLHAEDHAVIYKGVRLLISEWNKNERMERYAEVCRISESGFYQHFKEWAGVSPNEYRINMRISAAKSMLRNSAISVREIAEQVGFSDPYYFSRCFRRTVGVSPRVWRESQK